MSAIIIRPSNNAGFFSAFRQTLACTYQAEQRYGESVHLHYDWSLTAYAENGANVWERYFLNPAQPANGAEVWDWQPTPDMVDPRCDGDRTFLRARQAALGRHIFVAPAVMAQVDEASSCFKGKTVGVHLRGTDKYLGHISMSRFTSVEDYVRAVEALAPDTVFLASDDARLVGSFLSRFPAAIRNAHARSSDGRPLHHDCHSPELGRQVLVDCLCLARCSVLLHGFSNVPAAAKCFNPELEFSNLDDLRP